MLKLTAVLYNMYQRVRNDEGATAVEYGLMVSLIAVAIITTVGLLGTNLNTMFGAVKDKVATAIP